MNSLLAPIRPEVDQATIWNDALSLWADELYPGIPWIDLSSAEQDEVKQAAFDCLSTHEAF